MTRLIDVDELKKKKKHSTEFAENVVSVAEIDWQQPVDAEPVRHGKWIEYGSFKYKHGGRNSKAKELFGTEWRTMRRIKCSLCNKITLVDDTILYEYCPHCGAKMDGEQEKQNDS